MPSLLAYLAPFAFLLPGPAEPAERDNPRLVAVDEGAAVSIARSELDAPGWQAVEAVTGIPLQHQVRIERRMTIRISPISPTTRENLVAEFARPHSEPRYLERRMGKCVPLRSITAAQTAPGNRLMLYMRDQRIVSASLEKSCRAQDFYSGFYVEPSRDGMLCVDRDKLQARTGAKCEVSRLRELVPFDD
ncbi:hypothetical protein J4558_03235 [Leptolyngbya sp. 15MV]|nr:hypothetical protein J4558_03235 [Leptolyngbya sp. 15MV]